MKKLNAKGFGHIEILIIAIVMVAVVGVGFFVSNNVKDRSSKAETADVFESVAVPKDSSSPQAKAKLRASVNKESVAEESGSVNSETGNCANGKGESGARVQLLYITKSTNDAFTTDMSRIRETAAGVDVVFNNSAAKTGGSRKVRWARNDQCKIAVKKVVINDRGFYNNFSPQNLISTLKNLGYNKANTKYVAILNWQYPDDPSYYGQYMSARADDRPGQENNNNKTSYQVMTRAYWDPQGYIDEYAPAVRVRNMTWRLAKTLGAPQKTAPHALTESSGYFHELLTDASGILSAEAGSGVTHVCQGQDDFYLLDCNNDDYFNTNPARGSYLSNHWNIANSKYLYTPTN